MKTPIFDFISKYKEEKNLRLHMPGHKGVGEIESYDITEIAGADSLYEAEGIIRESEKTAGEIFGASTFYSTEGSSLSIRAALYIVNNYSQNQGKRTKILAGRNAHKSFISGAALLDIEVEWLYPASDSSYLCCPVTEGDVEKRLDFMEELPAAVYITSPDYLGNTLDIEGIARACHSRGVLLIVDNAHGAYLKFLPKSSHPIDLGADMCCDSAHKTLPVITGGAYLHVSRNAPKSFSECAKSALSLFGSTSPSYLILSSLDKANEYLTFGYKKRLSEFVREVSLTKEKLGEGGYALVGDEPMKITLYTKPYGYTGKCIAEKLASFGIISEFSDPDFLVLMPTPEIGAEGLKRLLEALLSIPKREPIDELAPLFKAPMARISPREALLSATESLPTKDCLGRTLAEITVGCPPAVPVLVSGEIVDESAISCFEYYGIKTLRVVK